MQFKKYMHVEKFGNAEVQGIEIGTCYVFPKIDGTNASCWLDEDGNICGGSRTRQLSLEADNAGFYAWLIQQNNIKSYLSKYPNRRLYGEWLVPHTLKTYKNDAWRKLYIFDIIEEIDEENFQHIPYNEYKDGLDELNIEYIAPIAIIKNGSYENFIQCLEKNVFLIIDGKGVGEGVVLKNYKFQNKYHRQTWAKIINNEFKDNHIKAMGTPAYENKMVEQEIVDMFCTSALIEKEYAKIVVENDGWSSKYIPRLLSVVFYCLITEEMWQILKEFKHPTINFKTLNALVINKIKEVKSDLF
jgi:hypothetical protein